MPGCDFYQPHTGILGASVPAHLDPLPRPLRFVRRWNPLRVAHFAVLRAFEARAARAPVLALSPRVVRDLARFHPQARAILRRPGVDLDRLSLAELRAIDRRFAKDVFKVLGVERSLASRASFGGTAPANVRRAAGAARRRYL